MKNYAYIGLFLIVVVFGILVIPEIAQRWNEEEVVSSSRSDGQQERMAAARDLAYLEVEGQRKKVPPFELVNQFGDTISNEDFQGKVYVVEFFFSTCPTICPIMKDNLVEVQEEFREHPDFGIASISIDPTHDTPSVLREYAENHDITHANWHLLSGSRDEIFALANKGFTMYAGEDPAAEGGFAHSGHFALVDQEGFIRSRRDQFGNPIVYYRGAIPSGAPSGEHGETPQIDILKQDIHNLLDNED